MPELKKHIQDARILVVDDKAANILLLEDILVSAGYSNVRFTQDPREVLPLHERHDFDLILLDIRMPIMDGFQVLEALSEMSGLDYIPVIVLTAQTDDDTRVRALELGARDFLTKPFRQVEVLHRIRNMLEVRMLYRQERWQSRLLESKVREGTEELRHTQLEIIRRLGRAGEYRDNETGNHVIRMSAFSQCLAHAVGLSDQMSELILHASPMHDVGKIGIPDSILLKPDRLDPDEMEIMRSHTIIGANILDNHDTELLTMAHAIALTHHERWDGTGYPQGLTGDAIPIEGRITAICDVFDALLSDRPYKKAWSLDRTISYMGTSKNSPFSGVVDLESG